MVYSQESKCTMQVLGHVKFKYAYSLSLAKENFNNSSPKNISPGIILQIQ